MPCRRHVVRSPRLSGAREAAQRALLQVPDCLQNGSSPGSCLARVVQRFIQQTTQSSACYHCHRRRRCAFSDDRSSTLPLSVAFCTTYHRDDWLGLAYFTGTQGTTGDPGSQPFTRCNRPTSRLEGTGWCDGGIKLEFKWRDPYTRKKTFPPAGD